MNTFGICLESSHKKGMGHFFRALNLIGLLKSKKERFIVFINNDKDSTEILKAKKIKFEKVELNDLDSDWETKVINRHKINIWISDRLDTSFKHAKNIIKNHISLITFDDKGPGARLADLHIAGLTFNTKDKLAGKKVLSGVKYLILNREIEKFRRSRDIVEKIIVSFGGSDTYGVTIKVLKILKELNIVATIHTGPSFRHLKQLRKLIDRRYKVISKVTSLIRDFAQYDLAITGGGITPFEANASGLPCLVISSEMREIQNCNFLHSIKSSFYLGHRDQINTDLFRKSFENLDIKCMSRRGMERKGTNGVVNIFNAIKNL